MRKLLCFVATFLLLGSAFAQKVEVSGKVLGENSQPLPGVSVQEKSTSNGTSTDANGNFRLSVARNATLVFSSVGYDRKEAAVGANPRGVTITLTPASNAISEVVVTSLGIRREKKALGYAVSTIDKKELELKPEADLARILNGKAPGLNILSTTGLTGSGTNINIRGLSTITGNSTPLIVVDGVPFDNSTNSQSNFTYGIGTPSRLLDIDANNIENVSILKGLSATTQYGEAGRNGVILISTKNGSTDRRREKPEITVSQSYAMSKAILPEFNDGFGGGFDISTGITFFSNWGGAFSNPPVLVNHPYNKSQYASFFPQYQGKTYEYKYYNSVPNFFRTGHTSNTSVNVAGSSNNLNYNINYGYTDDQGYLPGNRMFKNNFGMGGTLKVSSKLKVNGTLNYVINDVASPPTSDGYGNNSSNASIFSNVMYTPTSVDLMNLPFENPLDHSSVYYRNGNDIQNPRWTLYNSISSDKTNRAFGQLQATYEVIKGMNLSYRIGYDNYAEEQMYAQQKGGVFTPLGILSTTNGRNTIWDHNLLLQYMKRFGKVSLDLTAGGNSRDYTYTQNGQTSTQQLVYGIFTHNNFVSHTPFSPDGSSLDGTFKYLLQGVYGFATVGLNEYVYVTLGGRNDWSSKLEAANRSKFYPNASLSIVPTSAIAALQNNKNINFLKLRIGYSTSANFPSTFYDTRASLNIFTKAFLAPDGTAINTNSIPNKLPNPDLKPETPKEVEVGLEGRFIDNRVSLDFTYYNRKADNQILRRDIDPSTGYTFEEFNAGSVANHGIEVGLGITPLRTRDWNWSFNFNFTRNRSMVSGIPGEIDHLVYSGYSNFGNAAKNGQPLGIIYGSYFVKDPKTGQRIVGANGDYVASSAPGIIADPNPDYRLNSMSTLRYKGFSLHVQADFSKGGHMFSSTADALLGRGVTKDTKFDRAAPYILPGVDESGNPNTIQITATQAYFDNNIPGGGPYESGIYEATFFKFREASLSYELPKGILSKTPIQGMSLSISGYNLWYNAPNFPKYVHFDPEAVGTGVGNGRGIELLGGPSARKFAASVKLTF